MSTAIVSNEPDHPCSRSCDKLQIGGCGRTYRGGRLSDGPVRDSASRFLLVRKRYLLAACRRSQTKQRQE